MRYEFKGEGHAHRENVAIMLHLCRKNATPVHRMGGSTSIALNGNRYWLEQLGLLQYQIEEVYNPLPVDAPIRAGPTESSFRPYSH